MKSSRNDTERNALLTLIQDELCDTTTGPLSDTPYYNAVVKSDGSVFLYEGSPDTSFPDASIDVPQLVEVILANFLPEHDERVKAEGWDEGFTYRHGLPEGRTLLSDRLNWNPYRRES